MTYQEQNRLLYKEIIEEYEIDNCEIDIKVMKGILEKIEEKSGKEYDFDMLFHYTEYEITQGDLSNQNCIELANSLGIDGEDEESIIEKLFDWLNEVAISILELKKF